MISGGHLVAKALQAEGIDAIFTLCGGHIIDIYDGCIDEGIKVIDVRHEQVAAHAADGYARVTGKPGCAVVTAGPGTTDAITGVANAFRAESPMLLIGGQGALNQHQHGLAAGPAARRHDEADHEVRLERRDDRARRRHVLDGVPRGDGRRAGPGVPRDRPRHPRRARCRSRARSSPRPGSYRASTKSIGDPNDVDQLTEILIKAERPCVLLGSQVWTVARLTRRRSSSSASSTSRRS